MIPTDLDPEATLLRLAEAEPARAVEDARELVRRATEKGDLSSESIAYRALGVAALHLEDPDAALRYLRRAITLGGRARSPRLAAEARLRLAFVLNVRGRPRQALRTVELALRDLRGTGRARAQAQRGAILGQLGLHDEAMASCQAAIPVLRRDGDLLWLQRALSNRAVLYGYRNAFAYAEADLREAETHCRALDLDLSLGFIHQNLGWVKAVRGEISEALHYLDLAERCFRRLNCFLGELMLDRCQVLLSVGLVDEAREAAREAVTEFERERRRIGLPEARLWLARTALLDGDLPLAEREASRAAHEFAYQHRREWAVLARYLAVRARPFAGPGARLRALDRCAHELAEAGWLAMTLEARLSLGRAALEQGLVERAKISLAEAARGRRHGPALMRARSWHAEALLRFADGNRRGGQSALRAGLRVLDEYRTTLSATDLRAYSSGHRIELAEMGLRTALEDGSPRAVLTWAEQGRASHLMMRPVQPPDSPELAEALALLRSTVMKIQGETGYASARLVQQQVRLEREIRDLSRKRPAGPQAAPAGPPVVDGLLAGLGDHALVEFVQLDGRLQVITMVEGKVRLHRLCGVGDARDSAERIPFGLRRLALRSGPEGDRAAAEAMLRRAAAQLDALLLQPIAAELEDRPLVVVPTGPLQSLPWSVLPSCAGRPVSVAPSAALWLAARTAAVDGGQVLVAAGPGLPGAQAEAAAVAAVYRTVARVGAEATVASVLTGMDGAALAHIAAHGRINPANPLFSSLRLHDGPLTIHDLERLRRPPRLVVLAACDSASSLVPVGDELIGLTATFLMLGTRQIVAPVVLVRDDKTEPVMTALHRLIADGRSPAAALAEIQGTDADSEAWTAAAAFVSMGADPVPGGHERNLPR